MDRDSHGGSGTETAVSRNKNAFVDNVVHVTFGRRRQQRVMAAASWYHDEAIREEQAAHRPLRP